ncbi:MAG: radical SAM protein [Candidatus Shapirobacteria bacterium]|jgi:radical SAM superfamily enzyme YgiQ (UPF0313 family)
MNNKVGQKRVLMINTPAKNENINRDMAGGLGYAISKEVRLPPIDLLILAASIKRSKKFFLTRFVDGIAENLTEYDYYKDIISAENIDMVIGNVSLPTVEDDCHFYKKIKEDFPKVEIILKTGINYPKILRRIIRESKAEKVIFSECDLNFESYLSGKEAGGTAQIVGGKVVVNSKIKVPIDLDKLPIPARELTNLDRYKYGLLEGRVTTIQTSRGCPFPCSYYCPYPLVQGKRWRYMTAKRVLKEIRVISKLGIKNVLFRDATFTLDGQRVEEICREIIKDKIEINWWCETRINLVSKKLLILMRKAGCQGINVGVETLDRELLEKEGKPGVTFDDVKKIAGFAKEIGLKLHFLMMIGLPDDTVETLRTTLKQLVLLNPDSVGFSSITPYPGTKMFEEAVSKGLVKRFDWSRFDGSSINMRTKNLSILDIKLGRLLLTAAAYFLKRNGIGQKVGLGLIGSCFYGWEKFSLMKRKI